MGMSPRSKASFDGVRIPKPRYLVICTNNSSNLQVLPRLEYEVQPQATAHFMHTESEDELERI